MSEGIRHDLTSPALDTWPYAKRYQVWPPEGFTEPTRDELIHVLSYRRRANLRRFSVDELVRFGEVIDWFGPILRTDPFHDLSHSTWPSVESEAMDFVHMIRKELRKRPDGRPFFSIRPQRCGVCTHASGRLWEATPETHTIENASGELITAWVCARCWSEAMRSDA